MWFPTFAQRLESWQQLRHTVQSMSAPAAAEAVNQWWFRAPWSAYHLHWDDQADWPDPWQLLSDNMYCPVARGLGILYTIYFTSHRNMQLDLRVYYDYKDKERYTVACLDQGKYILNYWPYEIVNTKQVEEKQMHLLYQYSSIDLQLNKY